MGLDKSVKRTVSWGEFLLDFSTPNLRGQVLTRITIELVESRHTALSVPILRFFAGGWVSCSLFSEEELRGSRALGGARVVMVAFKRSCASCRADPTRSKAATEGSNQNLKKTNAMQLPVCSNARMDNAGGARVWSWRHASWPMRFRPHLTKLPALKTLMTDRITTKIDARFSYVIGDNLLLAVKRCLFLLVIFQGDQQLHHTVCYCLEPF